MARGSDGDAIHAAIMILYGMDMFYNREIFISASLSSVWMNSGDASGGFPLCTMVIGCDRVGVVLIL